MTQLLRPSDIYYSQSSIGNYFSSPRIQIGVTLDQLCEGRISVFDIDPITVTIVDGRWVTWDNRRLWVFRHLERLGKCDRIPVVQTSKVPYFRLTTKNDGNDVDVRGEPGGYWYEKESSLSSSSVMSNVLTGIGIGALVLAAFLKKD